MFPMFQVLSVFLVSLAMALSLAHALELPGKLRLDPPTYTRVQSIYYPGFTLGGMVGEAGGMFVTLALLLITSTDHPTFGWTLAALILLVASHVSYWLVTHPVNRFWLRGQELHQLGAKFFGLGRAAVSGEGDAWFRLRARWEYSHVLRAALAVASFLALVTGLALD